MPGGRGREKRKRDIFTAPTYKMANDQLHPTILRGQKRERRIYEWYKANKEKRCSSNLKIRSYHIAPSCVNASSPRPLSPCLSLLFSTYSFAIRLPTNLSRGDSTCRNETKECNSNTGGRTIPRFSSFRETYGAKSRVLFLKYFQCHRGWGAVGWLTVVVVARMLDLGGE